jgi:hypothetical protein
MVFIRFHREGNPDRRLTGCPSTCCFGRQRRRRHERSSLENGEYAEQPTLTLLADWRACHRNAGQIQSGHNSQNCRRVAEAKKSVGIRRQQPHSPVRGNGARCVRKLRQLMERAAAAVKAKVLVVASLTDHMVTPARS